MKTVRMIGLALFAILLCVNFTSCSSNDDVEPDAPQKPKEYVVSLGFTGEISVSESPLSRASENDLYGIQVYSCPNVDGATTYTKYAYGLFDDTDLMNIKLLEGYKYKFVATMVVDGKNKLLKSNDEGLYTRPFLKNDSPFEYSQITNSFKITNTEYFHGLGSGSTGTQNGHASGFERYYGNCVYIVDDSKSVSINMKRVNFGIKFIADGLTEGTLSVRMKRTNEILITHPETSNENIYTFEDLDPAYTTDNYSETISTELIWTKDDDVVVPLGTHDITFKRNVLTTVSIKVADVTTENGIGFELETTEMGTEDITIKNGEIVDTNVTPETGQ